MARTVIQPEEAASMATILAPPPEPELKETPEQPKHEPKSVKFRVTNVGRVNFEDGTWFDFHRPILPISDPIVIAKLTKLSELKNPHVFIL